MTTSASKAPLYLLTNDDGIASAFLRLWAQEVAATARVVVVAPACGQSGVGRALTVKGTLKAQEHTDFPCPAWSLEGTPTDCVNIALTHLLAERPAAVLSGINEGFNVGIPLLWSSGTLAAAIEGSYWGIPSWAASFQLSWEAHRSLLKGHQGQRALEPLLPSVRMAAQHMNRLILEEPASSGPEPLVHNVNFPSELTPQTRVVSTTPVVRTQFPFFQKAREPDTFTFSRLYLGEAPPGTDAAALFAGTISHSRLSPNIAVAQGPLTASPSVHPVKEMH